MARLCASRAALFAQCFKKNRTAARLGGCSEWHPAFGTASQRGQDALTTAGRMPAVHLFSYFNFVTNRRKFMSNNLYEIPVRRIDGEETTLNNYRDKVLLIVNVASKCGLTPQYSALEKLYEDHRADGLEVLGFPANNFLGQEPGTNEEIKEFCTSEYNVQFPLFSKISVKGDDQHPLYQYLTETKSDTDVNDGGLEENLKGYGHNRSTPGEVLWNFEKFLVGKNGAVVARFAPDVTPDDERLTTKIKEELAK
jgi:glutathione peroxidase